MTPQDTMTAEEIAAWEQQLRSQEHEEPVAVLRERHVRALKHRLWRAARKAAEHGARSKYEYYGCRCELCTKSRAARSRAWRVKQQEGKS